MLIPALTHSSQKQIKSSNLVRAEQISTESFCKLGASAETSPDPCKVCKSMALQIATNSQTKLRFKLALCITPLEMAGAESRPPHSHMI
jgi:hypothetical protein